MKVLKIQRKNLLNMKMVVNYLNFVFLIEVKVKPKYWIFEFHFSIYQKHKMTLWVHGFDSTSDNITIFHISQSFSFKLFLFLVTTSSTFSDCAL